MSSKVYSPVVIPSCLGQAVGRPRDNQDGRSGEKRRETRGIGYFTPVKTQEFHAAKLLQSCPTL